MNDLKKKICYAIIAALDFEVEIIKNAMVNREDEEIIKMPVYKGIIGDYDVVVMKCGMGKVSAGIGTQVLIDKYHPDYLINTGCAGGLAENIKIGDVVISTCVVEWDLDLSIIGYPRGYIDALGVVEMNSSEELCNKLSLCISENENVLRGMIASGDQFVSTDEQRKIIRKNFPKALCVEMEGAAVGHTCMQNNVPFCIIRTMSDTADGNSNIDFAKFSLEVGKKSAERIVKMFKQNFQ